MEQLVLAVIIIPAFTNFLEEMVRKYADCTEINLHQAPLSLNGGLVR